MDNRRNLAINFIPNGALQGEIGDGSH